LNIGVGDVWAVDTTGIASDLIRFGSELEGHPAPAAHVMIADHIDARGRWQAIQGEPGGVGWGDMTPFISGPLARRCNSNILQPKTDDDRKAIQQIARGLLTVGYDWIGGIEADALDDAHLSGLADLIDKAWGWHDPKYPNVAPGHVVCSSAASYVYAARKLARPMRHSAEQTQPADWWIFNRDEGWRK
jgi:hypothetical protein